MKAEREARAKATGGHGGAALGLRAWLKDSGRAVKENWVLFIFMVVLMSGFNAVSHGSQDFYPTFLKDQVGMNATQTTVVTVVGQLGAITGGFFFGYISTFFGRRLTMMTCCIIGGALVPAYTLPHNMTLVAAAFFEQFSVMGVWGPIPIFLYELSPPALSSLIVGFTYQLGNLASSASATIQAIIGSRYPLPPAPDGTKRFDYGKVIGIFLAAVWVYIFFFIFWAPEMTQEERDEEAERALRLENLRKQGASLAEIGEQMYHAKNMDAGPGETEGEKHEVVHMV
jgi:SHS family lactate transporter-like MFS transporter